MATYTVPGVYFETPETVTTISSTDAQATAIFIGCAPSGADSTPVLCRSWNDYVDKFARGMSSPFNANYHMPYCIYSYFMNGGQRAYVVRLVDNTATAASSQTQAGVTQAKFIALYKGVWGNSIEVKISQNANDIDSSNALVAEPTLFDIAIYYGGNAVENRVEYFTAVSNDSTKSNYFDTVLKQSAYIRHDATDAAALTVTTTNVTFAGGTDGNAVTSITATALSYIDMVKDASVLCCPEAGYLDVAQGVTEIINYTNYRDDLFAVFDFTQTAADISIRQAIKNVGSTCQNGAVYYGWITMANPEDGGKTTITIPSCGYVAGVIAQSILKNGAWKAPGGINYAFKAAIGTYNNITDDVIEQYYPIDINCIPVRARNNSICIWGVRSLNSDKEHMRYVSDVILKQYVKRVCYDVLEPLIFEPNTAITWAKASSAITNVLYNIWKSGGFKGSSQAQAFRVKCDADLNTEEVINAGYMIAEVAYAPTKPAEFIIVRLTVSANALS